MSKIFVLLLSICFLLSSCEGDDKEGKHIPKEKMEKIMLDINLAEAYSAMVKDSLQKAGVKNIDSLSDFYKDIFAHYNITREEFQESMNWYKNHPEDLDSVVNNLAPVINKMQLPVKL